VDDNPARQLDKSTGWSAPSYVNEVGRALLWTTGLSGFDAKTEQAAKATCSLYLTIFS